MRARLAKPADAAVIARIYNEGIDERTATFETRHRTADDVLAWYDGAHPMVVVEDDGNVLACARAARRDPRVAPHGRRRRARGRARSPRRLPASRPRAPPRRDRRVLRDEDTRLGHAGEVRGALQDLRGALTARALRIFLRAARAMVAGARSRRVLRGPHRREAGRRYGRRTRARAARRSDARVDRASGRSAGGAARAHLSRKRDVVADAARALRGRRRSEASRRGAGERGEGAIGC